MSLKTLLTELDERILGFLADKDLNAMSRTSKYYNKIAESHLYRRVVFGFNQNHRARKLLLTLLLRPDLASHIEEVEVTKSQRPRPTREQWSAKAHPLERALYSLQSSFTTIVGRHNARSGIRTAWLASILAPDYLAGTIALIACMATNIELLSYTTGLTVDNRHSPSFFSQILAEVASCQPISKRLTKLSKLTLQSMGHIELPRLPSLEFIKIADTRHVTFPQYTHLPMGTNLRKIEILHSFGRTFLPDFLHRDRIPHLKKLIFRDRWGSPRMTYQQVIDKLRTECPGLKYLKLTVESPYQGLPIPIAPPQYAASVA
jgi:hypothetical protein